MVARVRGAELAPAHDALAVEEPLEIRLHVETARRIVHETVSVTMRTPGDDAELAVGYLHAEGIVRTRAEIADVHVCDVADGCGVHHAIRICLVPGTAVDLGRLARHAYTTSACGVCGKTSLAALAPVLRALPPADTPLVDATVIHALPSALRAAQAVFARTGGLHAAALFDAEGALRCLREDVGRHNAVDKVVGAQLLADALPAHDRVLLVSGRASFELVQKTAAAGIPVLAAVGAPSSLAVSLAEQAGLTLLGFVRDDRFNVYAGAARIGVGNRNA